MRTVGVPCYLKVAENIVWLDTILSRRNRSTEEPKDEPPEPEPEGEAGSEDDEDNTDEEEIDEDDEQDEADDPRPDAYTQKGRRFGVHQMHKRLDAVVPGAGEVAFQALQSKQVVTLDDLVKKFKAMNENEERFSQWLNKVGVPNHKKVTDNIAWLRRQQRRMESSSPNSQEASESKLDSREESESKVQQQPTLRQIEFLARTEKDRRFKENAKSAPKESITVVPAVGPQAAQSLRSLQIDTVGDLVKTYQQQDCNITNFEQWLVKAGVAKYHKVATSIAWLSQELGG